MKRKLKFLLIPVCLILLLVAAFFLYTAVYYHADETSVRALESDMTISVSKTDYGWFFDGPGKENILCFYPGAKVEETAYAPLLHILATQGMDVCLVEMPFRLAVFGTDKAESVLAGYEHPNKYVGGHSLGGAVAAEYASAHPENLKGLILFAAYPTKTLDGKLTVISIYGSDDGILNMGKVAEGRQYVQGRYEEAVIEGGNHAQFGSYGEQRGDKEATVSRNAQQRQAADIIIKAIGG